MQWEIKPANHPRDVVLKEVGPIPKEAVIKRIRTLKNRIARAQKAAEQRVKEKLNASA